MEIPPILTKIPPGKSTASETKALFRAQELLNGGPIIAKVERSTLVNTDIRAQILNKLDSSTPSIAQEKGRSNPRNSDSQLTDRASTINSREAKQRSIPQEAGQPRSTEAPRREATAASTQTQTLTAGPASVSKEQLAQEPKLFLIELSAQGKKLVVLSNTELNRQQWVRASVDQLGKLQLSATSKDPIINAQGASSVKEALNILSPLTSQRHTAKLPSQLNQQQLGTLLEALKVALPNQQPISKVLSALSPLQDINLQQALPRSAQTLLQTLTNLSKAPLSASQMSSALNGATRGSIINENLSAINKPTISTIENAISRSGTQLETKFHQLLQSQGLPNPSKINPPTGTNNTANSNNLADRNALSPAAQQTIRTLFQEGALGGAKQEGPAGTGTVNPAAITGTTSISQSLNTSLPIRDIQFLKALSSAFVPNRQRDAAPADLKAQLLQAITLLDDLSTLVGGASTNPATANKAHSTGGLTQLVDAFFAVLNQNRVQPQGKHAQPHAVIEQLKQLLNSSLSKINANQIQHLLNKPTDPLATGNGGTFEIPIRMSDQIIPLTVQLTEYDDYKQKDEQDAQKKTEAEQTKRWHIYLEFDLDALGLLACDIDVVDHNVRTKLWIPNTKLWASAQHHMDDFRQTLENSGIVVEQLICSQASPPQKNMSIQQSLVDVRT